MTFGTITGIDPRTLGADKCAADDLRTTPVTVVALQALAADQLHGGDTGMR